MWPLNKKVWRPLLYLLPNKVRLTLLNPKQSEVPSLIGEVGHAYQRSEESVFRWQQRQDWIRTEGNFGRIRTGSDCNFFEIGGSGLDQT